MYRTLNILPLRIVRYSDKTSLLSSFSRELGTISFAIPAGNGPSAARRRALLSILTPLEVEASIRPGRDVHSFKEARALLALHLVQTDPVRASLAMFIAEALLPILRQNEGDSLIFDYIVNAMARLNDKSVATANFHIAFLVGLASLLGIAPDSGDFRRGKVFDMVDARFRAAAPLHGRSLSPEESAAAERLMRMTWNNMARFRFSPGQRNEVLNRILEYYTIHHANLSTLKSPEILHSLLS